MGTSGFAGAGAGDFVGVFGGSLGEAAGDWAKVEMEEDKRMSESENRVLMLLIIILFVGI